MKTRFVEEHGYSNETNKARVKITSEPRKFQEQGAPQREAELFINPLAAGASVEFATRARSLTPTNKSREAPRKILRHYLLSMAMARWRTPRCGRHERHNRVPAQPTSLRDINASKQI
ncbi:unnamed protein product, partial [Iphiclides podalirius]